MGFFLFFLDFNRENYFAITIAMILMTIVMWNEKYVSKK